MSPLLFVPLDQHRLCGSRQLSMLLEEPLPVNGLLGDRLA
jgi:hypothetical protein